MILSLEQMKQHDVALSEISVIHQSPVWDRLGEKNARKGRKLNGFLLMTQGQCRYEWDDETAILNPGALIYLPSGCRRTVIVTGRPFSFYRISFVATELASGDEIVFSETPWFAAERTGKEFLSLAEAMEKSTLSRAETYRSSALMFEFLDALARQLTPHDANRIRPALDYLTAHYTEPVDVAHLARMCALSNSQFFAVFRKITGMSPIRYKNHLRITQARLLLAGGEITVQEVAELLGFESIHYFSRVFRDHTGVSPTGYFSSPQKESDFSFQE